MKDETPILMAASEIFVHETYIDAEDIWNDVLITLSRYPLSFSRFD